MTFKVFQKRAAILVALFLFAPLFSFAQKSETYKDIIEKAFNLSLQKDRTQAVNLIVNAIHRENRKAPAQKELLVALEKVATVFYSDKAQQTFEIGISLLWTDPPGGQSKLSEASRLEPGNNAIDTALTRAMIATNSCGAAGRNLEKMADMVNLLEDLQLLKAQLAICNSNFETYKALKLQQPVKRPDEHHLLWSLLEVEFLFRSSQYAKATEVLRELEKRHKDYPEIYYWRYKIGIETQAKSDGSAQKYVNLCKSFTPRQQRDNLKDPWLCRRTSEVENYIKKINNSEI